MLERTSNIYSIPVPKEAVTMVTRENPTHTGPYEGSVDIAVPVSTPVFAAHSGIVRRVRDDSDLYGDSSEFGQAANYITIEHPNNELSEYLHLDKESALVKVGDEVVEGQQIAHTGLSGWMTAPHLHFMVYRHVDAVEAFQCLKILFKNRW